MAENKGKVYLVGAGPGDPELITQKGLRCIQRAEVIVYDYLASNTLLNEAPVHAELIYAGKRSGKHHMSQEDIQMLLIEKAKEGKQVVRLKGGDPFIFGRGGEEALALVKAGIAFEIVPGISSAYSVPAYGGIPVTHRGISAEVHFITGHEEGDGGKVDYKLLAGYSGTLVFLMSIRRIGSICRALIEGGKDKETPAAVIQEGTTGLQKKVTGTLETIDAICEEKGICPPGILVIGDVVSLEKELDWKKEGVLTGKKVILTGTKEMARRQRESLAGTGAEVREISLIYTQASRKDLLKNVFTDLTRAKWILFTSRNGVRLFFECMKKEAIDYRCLLDKKFGVVGPGTGEALKAKGFHPDFMPEEYTVGHLAKGLCEMVGPSDEIFVFRASGGSKSLNECFDEAGVHYCDLAAYRTQIDWRRQDMLVREMKSADVLVFASGSAVHAFGEMKVDVPDFTRVICIGPETAKQAEAAGIKVSAVASEYTAEGVTHCLCQQNYEE